MTVVGNLTCMMMKRWNGMNKLAKFEQAHQSAMRIIQSYRDIEEGSYDYGMVCLVEWSLLKVFIELKW